ncbi:MAG: hypothetical protein WC875_01080 [Candidatus Absconditabacterales bacterium]|jgi:predicted transcriptional regulator of viral defense system
MFYSKKTLTANDLKLMRGSEGNTFKKRLSYQIKTHKLIKIRRGLYVVADQLYQLEEKDYRVIANSIYTPSYISYETVLRDEAVIFQRYVSVFVACRYTKSLTIALKSDLEPVKIQYQKMPDELLANPLGIKTQDGYTIATLERALCDTFWHWGKLDLDILNPQMIRRPRLIQIADLYDMYRPGFKKDLFANLKPYGITATVPE